MYIDNPRKLFDDLKAIPAMSDYMESILEDGDEENLEELIDVIEYNLDIAKSGCNIRWRKNHNEQIDKDLKRLKEIHKEINNELKRSCK